VELKLPVLPVMVQNELQGVVSRYDIEEVFVNIAFYRPSLEEVGRWIREAKKHKPIDIC
jgi:hypothetical protein